MLWISFEMQTFDVTGVVLSAQIKTLLLRNGLYRDGAELSNFCELLLCRVYLVRLGSEREIFLNVRGRRLVVVLLNQNRSQQKFQLAYVMTLVNAESLQCTLFGRIEIMKIIVTCRLMKPDQGIADGIKRENVVGEPDQLIPALLILRHAGKAKIWTDELIVGLH